MKINCELSISDRLLPLHNMNSKQKPTHALLSIGCKPSSDSLPNEGAFLMVCTAKNRSGEKYPLKKNVSQIFSRFANEGKVTIRLRSPEHDLSLCKCDPLELKCFLNVLKRAAQGLELKKEHLSTLVPASAKEVTKAQTRLVLNDKKDYPITSNFPKTLQALLVNNCNLKRFDARIIHLYNLTCLDLSHNVLREIPSELSGMSLKTLVLSHNQLARIPDQVFEASLARSLQVLELSDNLLSSLPRTIVNLKSLVRFTVNKNQLRILPYGLMTVRSLKYFQAGNNQLRTLPADFTKANLDELDLYGNPLKSPEKTELTNDVHNLTFPSLVELSARAVKFHRLRFTAEDLPRTLIFHLDQGRPCSCGSYCFQFFSRISLSFDMRMISRDVVRLESGSYSVRVEAFLCSLKCLRRYEKNPLMFWSR